MLLLGTMFSILSAHVSVASLLNGHVQPSQPRSQERTLGQVDIIYLDRSKA